MHQQIFLKNQHPTSGIARTGLGEFPVTSLSETELFEKFAVPQAEIIVQGYYLSLRDIQTFSGVNLDLSGTEPAGRAQCDIFIQIMTTLIIRSLEFLLLLLQGKRRRKIKPNMAGNKSPYDCHVPIVPKFFWQDFGMTVTKHSENLLISTVRRPRISSTAKSQKFGCTLELDFRQSYFQLQASIFQHLNKHINN
jgi:hypothetical protein